MGVKIVPINLSEAGVIQTDVLRMLLTEMGQDDSRTLIERAIYEISDRMRMLERALLAGEIEQVRHIAASLIAVSEQIGLIALAEIATDLARRVRGDDQPALHAVARRVMRVGETSLYTAALFPERVS